MKRYLSIKKYNIMMYENLDNFINIPIFLYPENIMAAAKAAASGGHAKITKNNNIANA